MSAVEPPDISAGRARAWVVEDSHADARRIVDTLSPIVTATIFPTGSGMLEHLAVHGPPDLIVLDWQLPDVSGTEVCQFVRERYDEASLPVILVTAMTQNVELATALAGGANDYVAKPFDPIELRARVASALRSKRLFDRARVAEAALERERARLVESELRFRSLADAGIIGIVEMDVTGNVSEANDAFLSMVGMTRSELAAGRVRMRELTAPDFHEADERIYRELLDTGASGQLDKDLLRPDGRRVSVLQGAAMVDRDRRRAVAFFLDVSEQRSLEADRQRLYEAERRARTSAESASNMKDEFLATVSHELRTPLNAVLGWSQLALSADMPPAQLAKALETIARNARAQGKLIDDILDISRIVSGKVRLEVTTCDLARVAEQALEMVKPAADAKGVRLVSQGLDRPAMLRADPDRLQQIAMNLLTNAVKFTPGGGSVAIELEQRDGYYRLSVSDSGVGIDPSFLPHVFDRFRQADATTTRSQGGLGLGLAIVRQLAELHGGRVFARSKGVGFGATFSAELPDAAVEDEPLTPPPISVAGPSFSLPPADPSLGGKHILIVDDEADSREFLGLMLERCGARISLAASAEEALALISDDLPDALVSDVGMPHTDGYGFLRELRTKKAPLGRVPAIALTAYARREDVARALQAGFDLHVAKPVDPGRLLAAVLSLVDRPSRSGG
jgi:PAS domain S-box-containing protein